MANIGRIGLPVSGMWLTFNKGDLWPTRGGLSIDPPPGRAPGLLSDRSEVGLCDPWPHPDRKGNTKDYRTEKNG